MYYNTCMKALSKHFHILFNDEMKEDIRKFAFETNVSNAEFIRVSVAQRIKKLKEKEAPTKNEQ